MPEYSERNNRSRSNFRKIFPTSISPINCEKQFIPNGATLIEQDKSSDIGNSHPSAIANKAIHSLKIGGGGYKTNGNII